MPDIVGAPVEGPAGKNIVVCCDGTGNQFGDTNSNVIKLYQVLPAYEPAQVTYYHPGLGTMGAKNALTAAGKVWTQILGGAFGYGISENIADAYQFLMQHYKPGDRVFMFGFSRGSYTARALCGLLQFAGLLHPGNEGQIPYAIRLFKSENMNKFDIASGFKATFSHECKPHFLGLFDTVSSVGWIIDPAGLRSSSLPYTARLAEVAIIRHAVSIDERRSFFRQNLVTRKDPRDPKDVRDLKEIWFAGVHSDVGGGYPECECSLSKITLRWMLREAQAAGMLVCQDQIGKVLGGGTVFSKPLCNGMQHNSLTPGWYLGEFWPKHKMQQVPPATPDGKPTYKRVIRPNLFHRRRIPEGVVLHESVLERQKRLSWYKPANLPKTYTVEPEPPGAAPYPGRLEVGGKLDTGVFSPLLWNDTTVEVRRGERYQLSATGNWFDKSIKSGAEGYASPNFVFHLVERWRRAPRANWFALIVTIGQDLSNALVVKPSADSQATVLEVDRDGTLYAFANDLPGFYGNNRGCLTLSIERLA